MLLSRRRGTRMGKEERREISRRREGTVPAPGPSGSPSPPLPTAEKRQLPPGREAMPSGARAPSGVQGAAPPSPILRRSLLCSRTEPRPRPPGGGRRRLARGPCHPGDATRPQSDPLVPAPAARPLPAPPHPSHPAVGLSLAPYPPQRRSSVAATAAAAATATESSIPAGATWNSRASRGARGSPGLRPLGRTARLTPAPSRTESPRDRPPPDKTRPEPPLSAQHPLPRLPPPPPPSLPPPPHLSH